MLGPLGTAVCCGSQSCPAANRHVGPFGIVMISVQVDPVLAVNSSMRPPLPATPMPTGASLYRSESCARTSSCLPPLQTRAR